MTAETVGAAKQRIRERVWDALEASGASRAGEAHGRIPDFVGAEMAAQRLADLAQWAWAGVVKVVPDRPQRPVRRRALRRGSWFTWPRHAWRRMSPSSNSTRPLCRCRPR